MNAPTPRLNVSDDPFMVYRAPYFTETDIMAVIGPTIITYLDAQLPILLPPYIDPAAEAAVQNTAVLLAGSTMSGPLMLSPLLPTAPSMAATKSYVDTMIATVDAALTGYLPLTGGTLSGGLTVAGMVYASQGRIVAQSLSGAVLPSISCWDVTNNSCMGLWDAADTLVLGELDGNGIPLMPFVNITENALYLGVAGGAANLFGIYGDAANRGLRFQQGFEINNLLSNNDIQVIGGNSTLWSMRVRDGVCVAWNNSVAGNGPYIDGIGTIPPLLRSAAPYGLDEVLQLNPVIFRRPGQRGSDTSNEIGFLPEDLQQVIPEAVRSLDGMLGHTTTPILAACVNAIKELTARLTALEAGGVTLPART
jgi:hypothetical protein